MLTMPWKAMALHAVRSVLRRMTRQSREQALGAMRARGGSEVDWRQIRDGSCSPESCDNGLCSPCSRMAAAADALSFELDINDNAMDASVAERLSGSVSAAGTASSARAAAMTASCAK